MGIRVLYDETHGKATLYDSVKDVAFGLVFQGVTAQEQAEDFLEFVGEAFPDENPRLLPDEVLWTEINRWQRERLDEDGELKEDA